MSAGRGRKAPAPRLWPAGPKPIWPRRPADVARGGLGLVWPWAGTQAGGKCKAPTATTARTAPGRTRVVAVVPFGSRACKLVSTMYMPLYTRAYAVLCTQCNVLK